MDTAEIAAVLADPVTTALIDRSPVMRLAYTGRDGAPRVIPLAYLVRDGVFVFFTAPSSAKYAALVTDPRVAITIDIPAPLCCLFVRGTAEVSVEPGVPDDYLEASYRNVPVDQQEQFTEQVRGLYDEMARIVVTPTFVRLNDFQRTAPKAIEDLIAAKQG